jgi:formylglycine-generating enzyme required for sulfatase activity
LPTEAQWEKAASWNSQNATKRRYPWGDGKPDATLLNFQDSHLDRTQPIDSYLAGASAYGLLNMAGNVWEWVADWYDKDYYRQTTSPWVDPTGPDKGKEKVVRGGSYGYGPAEARSAFRNMGDPQKARGPDLGFRCAVIGERLP